MMEFLEAFKGNQLTARVLRSTLWVLMGYGGTQVVRLASNLILTRILFPEAFGLMALVTVITVGLLMFSDAGMAPSIAQSKRGDDPDFLNTAWTVQVLRGGCLAGACLVLARPMAEFYNQPDLAFYLPFSSVALILNGFMPTRVETAHRHLMFGRLTVLDLISQMIGVGLMVLLALATHSVMALVAGGMLSAAAKLILTSMLLPGARNRFRLEGSALKEMTRFGKWIFLSTAFTFLGSQGDKALLGKLVSLDVLGVYNVGYFLASFPLMLGGSVVQQVMIPIYRDRPPGKSPAHRARLRKMRFLMSAGLFFLLGIMALIGPALISVLYDARYQDAGAMIVVLACSFLPRAMVLGYDRAALAAGDSRGAFLYSGAQSTVQMILLYFGFTVFGLVGGLASFGVTMLIAYPILVWLARRHRAWDAFHDLVFGGIALSLIIAALWLHADVIRALAAG